MALSRRHGIADITSLNFLKHQKFKTEEASYFLNSLEDGVLRNLSQYQSQSFHVESLHY